MNVDGNGDPPAPASYWTWIEFPVLNVDKQENVAHNVLVKGDPDCKWGQSLFLECLQIMHKIPRRQMWKQEWMNMNDDDLLNITCRCGSKATLTALAIPSAALAGAGASPENDIYQKIDSDGIKI